MSRPAHCKVRLQFFTPEQGGRPQVPTGDGYAPYARVAGNDLPVRLVGMPGDGKYETEYEVLLELTYHPSLDYSALAAGTRFELIEGPRVVAQGIVVSPNPGPALPTRGLIDVGLADLELLAQAFAKGSAARLDAASLQKLGVGHLAAAFESFAAMAAPEAGLLLEAVLAERRLKPVPRLELVWTGKEAGLRPSRDTAVVVRELFARAEKSVVIGGFRFDHGEEILAPLYQAMAERGAEVKIFVDIERAKPGQDPDKVASVAIERFYAVNWPFGLPRPELFFDPETVAPGAQTSLHAKCLVVDRRWALVSSANFTERGLTRNLEAGVLIEDTTFARRLSEQWLVLVDSGQMRPYRP